MPRTRSPTARDFEIRTTRFNGTVMLRVMVEPEQVANKTPSAAAPNNKFWEEAWVTSPALSS